MKPQCQLVLYVLRKVYNYCLTTLPGAPPRLVHAIAYRP